jgi:hypothetical protein
MRSALGHQSQPGNATSAKARVLNLSLRGPEGPLFHHFCVEAQKKNCENFRAM